MFVGAYGEASGVKPHHVKPFLLGIHGHVSGCTTGCFELLRAKLKNLFEPVQLSGQHATQKLGGRINV